MSGRWAYAISNGGTPLVEPGLRGRMRGVSCRVPPTMHIRLGVMHGHGDGIQEVCVRPIVVPQLSQPARLISAGAEFRLAPVETASQRGSFRTSDN